MLYHQTFPNNTEIKCVNDDSFKSLSSLDCFSIAKSEKCMEAFQNPRLKEWMNFDTFVIFGTGGSSLGGQCIHATSHPKKKIYFENNLDTYSLERLFLSIDLEKTGFLCISKSGETLETISQTLLAIEFTKNFKNLKDRFVIITEDKESSLREIATKFDFLCFEHPKTIGGRFSVFSIVGMLPALLCGIDPLRIRAGGKSVLENFQNDGSEIQRGASFVYNSFKQGKSEHISFIYSDKLSYFGDWLAQLYAESSGKDGVGITPIKAMGAVDQHSQLQLYLDGTQNKCFTFFVEKQHSKLPIFNTNLPSKFEYLRGKNLSDIFSAQSTATFTTLTERKYSLRKFEFENITPEILGALFMHFMLEVVCVCKLMKVDPFNQPAVERGKIITKALLSGDNVD
ncbi:MAG: hypothetical protein K6C34_03430 [Alphaproteobacteria bacterium]|nr:hypothetical protein [Alphaproteobacteria bacterium]